MVHFHAGEHPHRWDEILGQAKFAYNSMVNCLSSRSPFSNVYTKVPNQVVDLTVLPRPPHKAVDILSHDFTSMLKQVRTK